MAGPARGVVGLTLSRLWGAKIENESAVCDVRVHKSGSFHRDRAAPPVADRGGLCSEIPRDGAAKLGQAGRGLVAGGSGDRPQEGRGLEDSTTTLGNPDQENQERTLPRWNA